MSCWRSAGLGCFLLGAAVVASAQPDAVRDKVRAYRAAHEKEIVGELTGLLALPNVATRVADVERNADHLTTMLERRGFAVQRLSAGPGTPPAPYRGLRGPRAPRPPMFFAPHHGPPGGPQGGGPPPLQPRRRPRPP